MTTSLRWCTTFEVHGRRNFPIDMLRYDQCHPMTETDSQKIKDTYNEDGKLKVIKVSFYHEDKRTNYPTEERWESFGWKIVQGSIETRRIGT